ncbi:MAG: ribosomal protein S18 acetylase RimI-like enzyme [Planctomycetota bacterium]|jgi:ribosomal protein S18 acetylase RimI-like enzyme
MQISDHAAAIALWQQSPGVNVREADSYEAIETYLNRNPGLSFVAMDAEQLLGTIMAGHDGRRGYIQHLAVDSQVRNSGIGGELIDRCLAALKRSGIVKSHVHIHLDNDLARRYWSNRGWQERGEVTLFSYINGGDANA